MTSSMRAFTLLEVMLSLAAIAVIAGISLPVYQSFQVRNDMAARDATFDEFFSMPTSITPSGLSEIVFAKFTGMPTAIGATTLTSSINENRTISINAKGMVSY